MILPPSGKSGPLMRSSSWAVVASGFSMRCTQARTTSPRLCGGMLVAIDGAEVPLAIDERRAHDEVLGHADHGVVDRFHTVGMKLARDIARDARTFRRLAVEMQLQFVKHCVEDTPLHRLQPVAHVRQ